MMFLGDAPDVVSLDTFAVVAPQPMPSSSAPSLSAGLPRWLSVTYQIASVAGIGLGAYHGYKRHGGSVGWALGWALVGGIVPIVTIPLSMAQGFGRRM